MSRRRSRSLSTETVAAAGPRYVTVRISKETHERLLNAGRMGDSFDSVIGRLLDKVEPQRPPQPTAPAIEGAITWRPTPRQGVAVADLINAR